MNKESVHAMIKLTDNHADVSAGAKNGENKNNQGQVRDLWNNYMGLYLIYLNVSCCYLAWQPQHSTVFQVTSLVYYSNLEGQRVNLISLQVEGKD